MTNTSAKGRWKWREIVVSPAAWIWLLALVALAVRLYHLGEPVLRWDEGWSLAHASLPWRELWQVATEEWHPPLYAALLKVWLVIGKSATRIRLLSVLLGMAAVPLAALVADAWSGRARVAIFTAGLMALWPLLVYYGQVARMYALAVLPVLAATWFILRGEDDTRWYNDLGLALSASLALYTLYYTAWPLAGLWIYAAIVRPRRIPRLIIAGLGAGLAYLPWLLASRSTLQSRIGTGTAMGKDPILGTLEFLKPTIGGLTFVYGSGWHTAVILGVVLIVGIVLGLRDSQAKKLLLPLLAVGISVVGIAYGAQASRWFAVRHLVPASAFLLLALAWALDRLAERGWPLLLIALLALGATYWPASAGTVYAKMLEVVDPFDPSADYRFVVQHAGPNDLIYFNVLARAGWYENLRRPQDPAWSYAMRWDPIIEPMEQIAQRIGRDTRTYERLWFVLYKGTFGPNGPLKDWLDATLYPAGGEWREDVLFLAYAAPQGKWKSADAEFLFANGIRLKGARWTESAKVGGACALEVVWDAAQPFQGDYKVFVHAVDEMGQLVAQHDAPPGTGSRPTTTWQVGEDVPDRHGLFLPVGSSRQRLRLLVGLYDSSTGQRLLLADGSDAAEVGSFEVE